MEASQAAGLGQHLTAACAVEAPVVNSRVSDGDEHVEHGRHSCGCKSWVRWAGLVCSMT